MFFIVNIHKNLNIPEGIVYTFIKETLGIRSQNQINSDKAYKLNEVEKERIKSIYFASSSINASKELNIPKHVVFEYIKANNLYKEKLIYKKEKLKPIVLKMYLEDKMSLLEISRTKIACQRIIKDIVKELDITRTFKECMTNLQLKKGYTLKNNDFFNVIDNELKAYWLGFIYADGSINKKITVLSISLKSTDTLHLEKFANLFNKKVFIYKRKAYINLPERTCCSLRISNTFIANDLNNKGIVPRKTYVDSNVIFKHIPNDLVRHFIRGYFDGDGCVTSNNAISFVCNSSLFLQGIKKFLNKVTNKDRKLKQVKDKTFFLLTYTGLDSKKNIFDYFYKDSTVFLERKKNKFNLD